jgi:alkylhydroperoxidase/carboxymuconolactone decarboxylase family protein YurZ
MRLRYVRQLGTGQAALRHGATEEEIAEALGVAINADAALVYSTRVLDAVRKALTDEGVT